MARKQILLFLIACSAAVWAGGPAKQKKLIEFGWDEPDPVFIHKHAQVMRSRPFDGTIFHLNYKKDDGKTGSFTWEAWGKKRFREADLEPSIAPLRDADLGEFRHNFPRFNVTPGDVDWFDDYSAIVENARLVAWYAKQTNCPGVALETEQYTGHLFEYAKQRDRGTKSYEQYAAQARLRGREVMQAFQKAYPGLKVFLSLGFSYPVGQMRRNHRAMEDQGYGLLAPFLNGLLDAAEGETTFIDGHESAYHYLTPEDFGEGYKLMRDWSLPAVAEPKKYAARYSFSYGIWMDRDSNKNGWSAEDFSKNGHSPERLERLVAAAMESADEYVWLYSERLKWWTDPEGAKEKVPEVYEAAVRRARARANAGGVAYPRVSEEQYKARVGFLAVDRSIPLESKIVQRWEKDGTIREKIVFRGGAGVWVPGMLEMPKSGKAPYPLVLLVHGWSGSKQVWWEDTGIHRGGLMRKALLAAGYAVLALDAATHGERSAEIGYQGVNAYTEPRGETWRNPWSFTEISVQTTKDYQKVLDYVASRGDIDMSRVGLVGYSMGGMDSFYLLSVEPRVRMAVACVPPLLSLGYGPMSPVDFSWGLGARPFLMIMGRQDTMYEYDKVNASFRAYIEGPDKKLVWLDKGHGLTELYIPIALDFVKQYLPVEAKP